MTFTRLLKQIQAERKRRGTDGWTTVYLYGVRHDPPVVEHPHYKYRVVYREHVPSQSPPDGTASVPPGSPDGEARTSSVR